MILERKRVYLTVTFFLIIFLLTSVCNLMNANSNNEFLIPGLESTLAVQTMVARPELMYILISPTPTAIPTDSPLIQAQNSQSINIIDQSQANNDPIPSLTAIPTQHLCKNSAKFIKDITVPDYSVMNPKESFVKTWRFENTGTCPWTDGYAIVFLSGEQMGGQSPTPIGQLVLPGEQVDISVNFTAPNSSSAYKSTWIFISDKGDNFGTGFEAGNPFWVAIDVKTEKERRDYFDQALGGCGPSG